MGTFEDRLPHHLNSENQAAASQLNRDSLFWNLFRLGLQLDDKPLAAPKFDRSAID
jgi:hypothetical protein